MHIITRSVLCSILVCLPLGAAETVLRPIAPGVDLTQIVIPASEPGGPELIHVLSVGPDRPGIRLEAGLGGDTVEEPGGGMEGVAQQVIRTGALAGINADFFPYTGDPLGLAIHHGEIVSEPNDGRGAVGFTWRGRPVIGRPSFQGSVSTVEGVKVRLNGIDRKPGDGEMVLFTPIYGAKTPDRAATVCVLDTPATGLRAGIAVKARVVSNVDANGAVPMPRTGMVVTATGNAAVWLKANGTPGSSLYLKADIVDDGRDWSIVREAVAGGPVLLTNGREDIQLAREKMGQDFSTTRHPRTAVGITKDGRFLLVAVDGRQMLSRGMSLPELAKTMADLGCVDALNLDGGGSTCLSVRGLVINCPSDGQVRRVADSLLLFDDAVKPVTPAALKPNDPAGLELTSGESTQLAQAGDYLWGTLNGGAAALQKGMLYGYKPGLATAVGLGTDGRSAFLKTYRILPGRAGKLLLAWNEGTLQVTVRDANNNPVQGQEVTVTKQDGTSIEVTTAANGRATTPPTWLKDEREPVTLMSGVLTKAWPEQAP